MSEMTGLNTVSTRARFAQLDKAWLTFGAILCGVILVVPHALISILRSVAGNLAHTGVFILFAVLLLAWLRATGAEGLVGKAFQGKESRMIVLASLVGGLAPFCSCEVVPFIAALLAMGTPLSAVMAFWLSSPIMDPPMFVITASALGVDFAVGKTVAAVCFGLLGGFAVKAFSTTLLFAQPLRENSPTGCQSCCGSGNALDSKPEWRFWQHQSRIETFTRTAVENFLFLFKWLALAYLLEALMVRYIPAEWISSALGGEGLQPIFIATVLGGPAYLNGYAAVPLIAGMLDQGMGQGAAMAFVLAGSVSCIPAAVAVWALVKPRVFVAYIMIAMIGAFIAGVLWSLVAS